MIEAEAVVERIAGYLSSSLKVWIGQRAKTEVLVWCNAGWGELVRAPSFNFLVTGNTQHFSLCTAWANWPKDLGLPVGDTGNSPCSQPYPREVIYYETRGKLFIPEYDYSRRWRLPRL
jgi:hypothetical protein